MLDFSLIHKLFNQTVMGKQAFVKAYACFQTTASPRPFDYEYINIRLLSQHNCLVGSIRVNTDNFYTPMFHKPLSLFGRGYSLRYRFLYLRNVTSVPCNKRTDDMWFGNQTIKQKCK